MYCFQFCKLSVYHDEPGNIIYEVKLSTFGRPEDIREVRTIIVDTTSKTNVDIHTYTFEKILGFNLTI